MNARSSSASSRSWQTKSASQQSVREIFAGPVTREDWQLVWMFAGLVSLDVAVAAYLSLFPIDGGFLYFIVGIMFGASVLIGAGSLRFKHHYSAAGFFWFLASIGAFQAWNIVIMWGSLLSRWWTHNQPGYHIGIGAIVGLIPLVIGIWKLGQKLTRPMSSSNRPV